jgi:hypothetical protein
MVYGETGVYPIHIDIKSRIISFWANILENGSANVIPKLSVNVYKLLYGLHEAKQFESRWISNVKNLLCSSGFSGIWYSHSFCSKTWLIKSFNQRIKDNYIQKWKSDIENTSNTNIYKLIKTEFKQSTYLTKLPQILCKSMFAFRTRNHRLPVETGRWRGVSVHDRKCSKCNDIGDEFHYLLICQDYANERSKYIPRYYYTRPNMLKFKELLNSENINILKKLAVFQKKILTSISS